MTPKDYGLWAESQACAYLTTHQHHIIERNFSCRCGEIDIIAHDTRQDTLVFVEVRARQSLQFGLSFHSVHARKQARLQRSAAWYLQRKPSWQQHPCRFDVLGIDGSPSHHEITWLKNAFLV